MNRRDVLAGAAALTATTVAARADRLPLGDLPGTRYPDPRVEALDKRFRYKVGNAAIERIATGFRWAEGPVYFRDGGYLLWSDIPNNRIMRWLENGHVSVYRANANYSNGNTRDRQGRLITCEHDTRRVTRTEPDGTITVLIDRFDGKPLNAPNDVVVASDNAIWFTDPGYGIDGFYEGHKDKAELPTRVYRLDPATGQAKVAAEGIDRPNGLAFSPDEKILYVVDSGLTHGGGPTSAPSTSRATNSPATGSSPKGSRRASPTGSAPMSTATSGARWAGPTRRRTGCAATRRPAT